MPLEALDKWPLGEHFSLPQDGMTHRHMTLHSINIESWPTEGREDYP